MSSYKYTVHYCPGKILGNEDLSALKDELRGLGVQCLTPLPNYQVFSDSPNALDDKIIITAHDKTSTLIAFTSAVLIPVEGLQDPIVHTGLTCIAPHARRQNLVVELMMRLFYHHFTLYPRKCGVTTFANVAGSLVSAAIHTHDAFPSPAVAKPSAAHLQVVREISKRHRHKMHISSSAVLDEDTFIFHGAYDAADGQGFVRDLEDKRYWHTNAEMTQYYLGLLGGRGSDAILQVGWLSPEHLRKVLEAKKFEGNAVAEKDAKALRSNL
ncbi:hypothetical protein FIBSPDRAFT_878115 [Athelia psychrophila]|uniref:N-acetyltransferase domain-containing protein n=1 Tax=Athelia psychrophila TaxID=1759441 RepID=A0A167VAT2_9AGAM|nr:hypothetical protein FIBSPDRAFT_878115 [Fibularhizoctonia sp. CBS 109695]